MVRVVGLPRRGDRDDPSRTDNIAPMPPHRHPSTPSGSEPQYHRLLCTSNFKTPLCETKTSAKNLERSSAISQRTHLNFPNRSAFQFFAFSSMKFTKFCINNFKGIKSLELDLKKAPTSSIITLIGLNESGKTTVLEALNYFSYKPETIDILNIPGAIIKDVHDAIPLSERGNFNGSISIEAHLEFDPSDMIATRKYALESHNFSITAPITKLVINQVYPFKNSEFQSGGKTSYWTYTLIGRYPGKRSSVTPPAPSAEWQGITKFIGTRIPAILFFPSFLAEIPDRIYLDDEEDRLSHHYASIIQDILSSIDHTLSSKKHIADRLKEGSARDLKNLDGLLLQMSTTVTASILGDWAEVFGLKMNNRSVVFSAGIDSRQKAYVQIKIKDSDGYYAIAERSLGFRWFFGFVLLIGFRSFRRSSLPNPIYLLDEPAANLHPAAQLKVRDALSRFSKSATIIFATHSQHLINPKWLEGAYIVKNDGSREDFDVGSKIDSTNIEVIRYREFVSKNPSLTTYFKPVLDVLDYVPSDLEFKYPTLFVEGKNDFYCFKYFSDLIIGAKHDWRVVPASGSSAMDSLIGWYLGWAKEFYIVLDSDEAGKKQRTRYLEEFGPALTNRICLLSDINPKWIKSEIEDLIAPNDASMIVSTCFSATEVSKGILNRAIQQLLMSGTPVNISDQTKSNFSQCFDFISNRFKTGS